MSQRTLTALWLAVVLIGMLQFKRVRDTDIFWQIKLGQIMLERGGISVKDPFTYTHAGEPVPPIYVLSQVLYAALHGAGGWPLTRLVHQFALAGSLVLAAATCRRDQTSAFSVALAMAIAFLVMLSNADLRPQGFALVSFAAFLALARSPLPFKIKLVVAVPLLVAWQNMHPSVVVGAVALAGLAAADVLGRERGQTVPWQTPVLAVLAGAAQLATPIGARVLDVSLANVRISRDVLRIDEWLPPWDPTVIKTVDLYWLALVGSLVGFVWLRRPISARDRALLIVMTLLSMYAARFIIFWAVALVPFWAEVIEHTLPSGMFAWARGPEGRPARAGRSILWLGAALVIVVGVHPARFQPIFDPAVPLDGVKALRTELPGAARIYGDYFWGGPLILDGSPGWRVAVDGRLYFFPDPAEWRSIADASAGRISLDEVELRHRPDAFFLYPPRNQALIQSLSSCPRWRLCFRGPTCLAFVRVGSVAVASPADEARR